MVAVAVDAVVVAVVVVVGVVAAAFAVVVSLEQRLHSNLEATILCADSARRCDKIR